MRIEGGEEEEDTRIEKQDKKGGGREVGKHGKPGGREVEEIKVEMKRKRKGQVLEEEGSG